MIELEETIINIIKRGEKIDTELKEAKNKKTKQ